MKKFITEITKFASVTAIVFIAVLTGIYFIQSKASFEIPPDKHILIIGDSHTECAINDEIYTSAVNVSQSASAYLYSYCKLKKFLRENDHIDTVFISFHYAPLIIDRWIFDEYHMNEKITSHLTLLDKEDIAIFKNEKIAFIKAIFNTILHPPHRIVFKFVINGGRISYKDLRIGGYLKCDIHKLQETIALHTENRRTDISFYQKEYLMKISDLCKFKNVKLILINSPTYKPEIYGNIDKLNDYYNTYLSGIKYMDYSAFPLPVPVMETLSI
jgi:hypothetical protein